MFGKSLMVVAQLRKSFRRPIGEYAGADIFMSRPMMALTVAPRKCAGNTAKSEETHASKEIRRNVAFVMPLACSR